MSKLRSLEVISDETRVSSIDVFRGIAVLLVLFYHFNDYLPFGYLGVDLFFVISGLLIGGILIREIKEKQKVNYGRFFISRGFKIWPSYYVYVLLSFWINQRDFDFESIGKYLFFYQNYTGETSHLWSLCVEEHFYLLLPLVFIAISYFPSRNHIQLLYVAVISMIVAGVLFKFASYEYSYSGDTTSATHNRIDALAWGVLFSLILSEKGKPAVSLIWLLLGGILFIVSLFLAAEYAYFKSLLLHSVIPFSFFCMIKGCYSFTFKNMKWLKFISYYSYNLYLWQAIASGIITQNFGESFGAFILFLILSMVLAILVTIIVEEKFMLRRKQFINYFFKNSI